MRRLLVSLSIFLIATIAAASDRKIHRTAQLDLTGNLSIDTHNGSITIATWNQANVDIVARIVPADFGRDEDVEKTDVKVTGSGGSIRIESDYTDVPTRLTWFGMQRDLPLIHYTISMPATARLDVDSHNASIRVTALRGDLKVNTHNGDVDIADFDGAANIESHNGDVQIGYRNFTKSARVETHNGRIDFKLPAQARFHLDARGHHMDMSSDFPITVGAMRDSRYVGDVNGGGPELRVSTHNGALKLRKL
ncbi:MAG TPA: DUF4097 family beta strand repeat-containing protein [Thermoanaerobaculia bacterium]|jgi:DUF4097 and DUF4098 domain-containing protein YvlB